ncbi:MAG TPA: YciI family protein [Steroidobacteraceae bacterium]|nr:YciI family protein [Steroidobacteraceae bacterium]
MKFICLGYLDEEYWATLSDGERDAMVKACTDYDVELHKGGHFASGAALQAAATATTVRWKDGKPFLTDGPFAETKELLGGILVLEAKDKEEAVRLIMRHPGIRVGGFEVRPADEAFMKQHPVLKSL